jgi:hypothetical protein
MSQRVDSKVDVDVSEVRLLQLILISDVANLSGNFVYERARRLLLVGFLLRSLFHPENGGITLFGNVR